MEKKQKRIVSVIIVILCFFLYGNSLNNDYAFDAHYVILDHPIVEKGVKGIPKIFKSHYVNKDIEQHSYRPITLTSFAIEYQFFGAVPKISHLINVLLYALTCMILFRLLLRLFKEYHWALALLTTLLFLILPVHSEVVNNVKSRDEILCFLFAILSLFQFVKYVDRNMIKHLLLGVLLIVLSVLSKPSSATFLVIIPMTLWFFADVKLKRIGAIVIGLIVTFIIVRFGFAQLLEGSEKIRDGLFSENPLYVEKGSLVSRIPMATFTVGYYLKLLFYPKSLICYYGYNHVPMVGWNHIYFWLSAVVVIPSMVYAFVRIKTKSPLVYGLLYFFVTISMFSNLIQPAVGIIAERFVYLPSLGFCIVIAFLLLKAGRATIQDTKKLNLQYKPVFFGLLSLILILSAARVITRTKDWKNKFTLLGHDIKEAPNSAKLNAIMANTLFVEMNKSRDPQKRAKLASQALPYYQKSVDLVPTYETSWNNMGTLYFNEFRDFEKARECYEKAVELKPEYETALFGLGYYYELQKEYDKSLMYYDRVLEFKPGQPRVLEHMEAVKRSMSDTIQKQTGR